MVFESALGVAKQRIGARFGSAATAGEGTQNLLCAYLGIAGWAVAEGWRAWVGRSCGCASEPGNAAEHSRVKPGGIPG